MPGRSESPESFLHRMRLGLARIFSDRAKNFVRSRTLAAAISITDKDGQTSIGVPHYWATFYHDGRGSSFPLRGRYLVWFTDPKTDPRHGGIFPVRLSEVRRLTRAEFFRGLEINRQRKAAAGKGGQYTPYMIIARASPNNGKEVQGDPFFEAAFSGGASIAGQIVPKEFSLFAQQFIVNDKSSAKASIR